MSDEEFRTEFIALAERHGTGIVNGDSESANLAHDQLTALLSTVGRFQIRTLLLPLCEHQPESVRLWAATYLLNHDEALAVSTIERIIAEGTIIGLTAEVTLDMWRTGTLNLQGAT